MNDVIMWATVAVALANVSLAITTWLYLRTTNKLVRLQREPNLQVTFDKLFSDNPEVVIRNAGTEAVVKVSVIPRHYLFREVNKPPVMASGRPDVTYAESGQWWFIDRIDPGQSLRKSLASEVKIYWGNHESMKKYIADAEKLDPEAVEMSSLVLLDVDFQREIDLKSYQITRLTYILQAREGETLKPVLMEPLYTFSSMKQAVELNSSVPVRGDRLFPGLRNKP